MAFPSSLGNRRARRGSVSQNITHTAVGFMSSNGVLPSSLLLPLILFYLFLPSSFSTPSPSPSTHTHPSPLDHHTVVLFFPGWCHFKTTTPFLSRTPSPSVLPFIDIPFTFFTSHHHPFHLRGARQGLVLHHSYIGRRRRHSTCTPIQSNTQAENSIKSTDTDNARYCFEWEFGLAGALG